MDGIEPRKTISPEIFQDLQQHIQHIQHKTIVFSEMSFKNSIDLSPSVDQIMEDKPETAFKKVI